MNAIQIETFGNPARSLKLLLSPTLVRWRPVKS
jgi:hypothetical protein